MAKRKRKHLIPSDDPLWDKADTALHEIWESGQYKDEENHMTTSPKPRIEILQGVQNVIRQQFVEAVARVDDAKVRDAIMLNLDSLIEASQEIGIEIGKQRMKKKLLGFMENDEQ